MVAVVGFLKRWGFWIGIGVVTLVLLQLGMGWPLSLVMSPEADVDRIERQLERRAERRTDAPVDARCPGSVDWETGGVFHCVLRVGSKRIGVEVSMENDQGEVFFRPLR